MRTGPNVLTLLSLSYSDGLNLKSVLTKIVVQVHRHTHTHTDNLSSREFLSEKVVMLYFKTDWSSAYPRDLTKGKVHKHPQDKSFIKRY